MEAGENGSNSEVLHIESSIHATSHGCYERKDKKYGNKDGHTFTMQEKCGCTRQGGVFWVPQTQSRPSLNFVSACFMQEFGLAPS